MFVSAEIALSQAKNDRLQSLATLYKALGGGWISEAEKKSASENNSQPNEILTE